MDLSRIWQVKLATDNALLVADQSRPVIFAANFPSAENQKGVRKDAFSFRP